MIISLKNTPHDYYPTFRQIPGSVMWETMSSGLSLIPWDSISDGALGIAEPDRGLYGADCQTPGRRSIRGSFPPGLGESLTDIPPFLHQQDQCLCGGCLTRDLDTPDRKYTADSFWRRMVRAILGICDQPSGKEGSAISMEENHWEDLQTRDRVCKWTCVVSDSSVASHFFWSTAVMAHRRERNSLKDWDPQKNRDCVSSQKGPFPGACDPGKGGGPSK